MWARAPATTGTTSASSAAAKKTARSPYLIKNSCNERLLLPTYEFGSKGVPCTSQNRNAVASGLTNPTIALRLRTRRYRVSVLTSSNRVLKSCGAGANPTKKPQSQADLKLTFCLILQPCLTKLDGMVVAKCYLSDR